MAREKPPEPPRLGWRMIRSRPPSASRASSKPGSSLTSRTPWSTTTTSSSRSSSSGALPSCVSRAEQDAGRSNVVMPTVIRGVVATAVGTHHSAVSRTSGPVPATRSNQYQPPSTNEVRGRVRCCVLMPSSRRLATRATATTRRGPVHDEGPLAGRQDPQRDLADRSEAPPVRRREGVEVGGERGATPGVDAVGPTAHHLVEVLVRRQREDRRVAVLVALGLGGVGPVDVQRQDVGVLGDGQHDPGHHLERAGHDRVPVGTALVDRGHRAPAGDAPRRTARMSSSPLSTKVSAAAIAMCMSRYW